MRLRIYRKVWHDRVHDALARIRGYCNHCPRTDEAGGGYRHWRCAYRRGHRGMHRYRNYVWDAQGWVEFSPVDCRPPSQPNERHGVFSRGELRAARRRAREKRRRTAA
ncbi:hypothetical protein [Streptomyces sp. AK08-02]|uniref:hypothetical protein n=1 Tax=Streptomyces sp. AK08-02 TaxID=3028654 RepID=UPI0029BE86B0|nr:hypothetical protein [Streptomyces sp. AK08-02]MDX3753711.1 hypothetical protein [Streptomyces sp. AK08-02]